MNAFDKIVKDLRAIGISVVPVGELERWFPSQGSHGPDHVARVHEAKLHLDPQEAKVAREFIRQIRDRLLKVK